MIAQRSCSYGEPTSCEGRMIACPRCGDRVCDYHAQDGLCLACQDDAEEVLNGLRGANRALESADQTLAGVLEDLDQFNAGLDRISQMIDAFIEADRKRKVA